MDFEDLSQDAQDILKRCDHHSSTIGHDLEDALADADTEEQFLSLAQDRMESLKQEAELFIDLLESC